MAKSEKGIILVVNCRFPAPVKLYLVLLFIFALHVLWRMYFLISTSDSSSGFNLGASFFEPGIQLTLDHFMRKVLEQTGAVTDHALFVIVVRVVLECIVHLTILFFQYVNF